MTDEKNVVTSGWRGLGNKHVAHPHRDEPICRIVSRVEDEGRMDWARKAQAAIPSAEWCGYCRVLIEERSPRLPTETAPRCEQCGDVAPTTVVCEDGRRVLCERCERAPLEVAIHGD